MDPTTIPPEIAHTMGAAGAMAVLIRSIVALLKMDLPLFGVLWNKLPKLARPAVLLGLTAAGFFFDHLGLGQPWYLAIGSALTALGGAVVSHEWQAILTQHRASGKGDAA